MNVLLITGPQGSGNHIWSKVLTTWADGDKWVGHRDEPHSHLWSDVEQWYTHNFTEVNTVVSVSCPFAVDGITRYPDINRWREIMEKRGIPHEVAVITRDKTINDYQNERVRPVNNYKNSVEYLKNVIVDTYLSTETLHIYKEYYLDSLNEQLKFDIEYDIKKLYHILSQSFNEKYISRLEYSSLDKEVWEVSGYAD
tara:strand:+ start:57 stop:647 length:591 start_codon:yes stop_codon:yes gene_type:complete